MSVYLDIDYSGLDGLVQSFKQAPDIALQELEAAMVEADSLLEREVKDATPTVTGMLRASIIGAEQVTATGVIGQVSTSISYAIPVELGSRPHVIVARDGGALSFIWHGKRVTVKSVNHPGTKGVFMFKNTLERQQDALHAIFDAATARIAARLEGGQA